MACAADFQEFLGFSGIELCTTVEEAQGMLSKLLASTLSLGHMAEALIAFHIPSHVAARSAVALCMGLTATQLLLRAMQEVTDATQRLWKNQLPRQRITSENIFSKLYAAGMLNIMHTCELAHSSFLGAGSQLLTQQNVSGSSACGNKHHVMLDHVLLKAVQLLMYLPRKVPVLGCEAEKYVCEAVRIATTSARNADVSNGQCRDLLRLLANIMYLMSYCPSWKPAAYRSQDTPLRMRRRSSMRHSAVEAIQVLLGQGRQAVTPMLNPLHAAFRTALRSLLPCITASWRVELASATSSGSIGGGCGSGASSSYNTATTSPYQYLKQQQQQQEEQEQQRQQLFMCACACQDVLALAHELAAPGSSAGNRLLSLSLYSLTLDLVNAIAGASNMDACPSEGTPGEI